MRDHKIDFIKGITIFLVIYGHCIQYLNKDITYDFFENPIFILIYMFHMPLFMLISGYFAYSSIEKKNFGSLIISKFSQLILPIINCVSLVYILKFFIKLIDHKLTLLFIKEYLSTIVHSFWFLWVLFGCYFIVSFGKNYIKKGFNYYLILIFIILILLPDKLNLGYLKFMYPYFIIGYFYKKRYNSFFTISKLKFIILTVIFITLYIFWEKDYYIYTRGMSLINGSDMPNIIIYRYISGLVGSFIFINLFYKINYVPYKNILSNLGQYTLGIYILQSYIIRYFIGKINISFENMFIYNFIITPIISLIITYVCFKLVNFTSNNNRLKKIILNINLIPKISYSK